MKAQSARATVDDEEVERFSRLADRWWDESGPLAPLHRINPVRIGYIKDRIVEHFRDQDAEVRDKGKSSLTPDLRPLTSFSLLDIGCGGGLVCEPLARLGARVTGIDASEQNIEAAKAHAAQSGLAIDYRCITAEALLATRNPQPATPFDIVLALEIIEHVADVALFVETAAKLVKPGGLLILSTINRTPKSFALAIVGAEYVLRWLPRGTHDWNKFLKPSELAAHLRGNSIEITDTTGLTLNPLNWKWSLTADLAVNYFITGRKSF